MTRAAIAVILSGLVCVVWTILSVWLYRETAPLLPDFLVRDRIGRTGLFGKLFFFVWGVSCIALALGSLAILLRLAKVRELDAPPSPPADDYPFIGRRLSEKASSQPGQEGYFSAALDKLDTVARSPLTPPARPRRQPPGSGKD